VRHYAAHTKRPLSRRLAIECEFVLPPTETVCRTAEANGGRLVGHNRRGGAGRDKERRWAILSLIAGGLQQELTTPDPEKGRRGPADRCKGRSGRGLRAASRYPWGSIVHSIASRRQIGSPRLGRGGQYARDRSSCLPGSALHSLRKVAEAIVGKAERV
jgi:hypothetical protein